jgi:hypothetical protein
MTGWWLVSYIGLWVLVLALVVFLLAMARELAVVRGPAGRQRTGEAGPDGPAIGQPIPDIDLTLTDGQVVSLRVGEISSRLIVFLTPMCEGCQLAVDRLNRTMQPEGGPSILVVLSGPESACTSFLTLFPVNAPVAIDTQLAAVNVFGVRATPTALLYEKGALVEKRIIARDADIAELLAAGIDGGPHDRSPRPSAVSATR